MSEKKALGSSYDGEAMFGQKVGEKEVLGEKVKSNENLNEPQEAFTLPSEYSEMFNDAEALKKSKATLEKLKLDTSVNYEQVKQQLLEYRLFVYTLYLSKKFEIEKIAEALNDNELVTLLGELDEIVALIQELGGEYSE